MIKNNYKFYLFIILHAFLSFLSIRVVANDYHLITSNLLISICMYFILEYLIDKKFTFKYINKFLLFYLTNLLVEIILFQLLNIGFLKTQFVSYAIICSLNMIINKKVNYEKYIPYLSLFNIAVIFLLSSPNSPIGTTNSLTDSSVFRYIGLLMTQGKTPYLDVFDHKGILLYVLNYFGCLINPNYGIWFIELILLFVALSFSYKIAKLYTNKFNSIITVLISFIPLIYMFESGNMTEEYALPFIVISLYLFLKDWQNKKCLKNINAFIIGICCSAVVLLKPNLISIWICLAIFLLIEYIKRKKYKDLLWLIFYFILGIIIFATPFIMYLICKGAFNAFIYDYLIFNFIYSANHGSMGIIEIVNIFLNVSKYVLIVLIVLICFLFDKKKKNIAGFNIFYLITTFILIVMPKVAYSHYGMIIVPTFLVGFCYMIDYLDKKIFRIIKNQNIKKILMLLILYSIIFCDIGVLSNQIKYQISGYDEHINITDIIKKNSKKDDNVLVYGNNVLLYLKSNRYTENKYPYQLPISNVSKKINNDFKKEFAKNKPDIIIVRRDYIDEINKNIKYINDEYNIIQNENLNYNLYVKNK